MNMPQTADALLRALADSPDPAPPLRGVLAGYDHAERLDVIELDAAGERVLVHAAASGFVAVLGRLPHPYTLADVSAEVARLYGWPPLFCERRRVSRPEV